MNKILMLDMDGAGANSDELIDKKYNELLYSYPDNANSIFKSLFVNGTELIFSEIFNRIIEICKKTDCRIVWSSSWRFHPRYENNIEEARAVLNRFGLPKHYLIGYTPDLKGNPRTDEIITWLEGHPSVQKCAILDDSFIDIRRIPFVARFFQTDCRKGLTEEIKNEIITYFNN